MNRACKLMVLPMALSLGVFSACSKDPSAGESGLTDVGADDDTGTDDGDPMPDMGAEEEDGTTGDDPCDLPDAVMCPDGWCYDPNQNFVPMEGNPCCGHGAPENECDDGVVMCDIWNPDDCPEGEKCTAYATAGSSWDANKCVMVEGDGQPGDDCMPTDGSGVSGNDDCDEGSLCWDIDADTGLGYCVEFCTGSANNPICSGDSLCAIYNNGVLPLCLPTCDPLVGGGDCPNTDNLCISDPGGLGFVCVLDASGGMGTYGTECQFANSCNQGLFCAAADAVPNCQGSQGCCSEFCDVNEANMCSGAGSGQECVAWFEEGMAPPGYEHVGGCAIPE